MATLYFVDVDANGIRTATGLYQADAATTATSVEVSQAVWEKLAANPDLRLVNGAPALPLPVAPTAAEVMGQRLAALGAMLAAKLALGVHYQPAGASAPLLFACDDPAQAKLDRASGLVDKSKWPAAGQWQPMSAIPVAPVAFTAADVTALAELVGGYVAACDINAATLAGQIGAGNNPDITAGWPTPI